MAFALESKKPTEETENFWIFAKNATAKESNKQPGENCGKWLIFEPYASLKLVWATIKRETETGELGCASKVSTMRGKGESGERDATFGTNFVICVYTYDHTDENDVMRVRERLKELGFSKKLPYKTDAATYAGEYRHTTGGRVSKHYC